jgi:hypothetical protein
MKQRTVPTGAIAKEPDMPDIPRQMTPEGTLRANSRNAATGVTLNGIRELVEASGWAISIARKTRSKPGGRTVTYKKECKGANIHVHET